MKNAYTANIVIYPYLIVLLFVYITSMSNKTEKSPIKQHILRSILKELDDWDNAGSDYDGDGFWDEGRFIHHSVSYANQSLIIEITAHSDANYIAMGSFCDIVRRLHRKYAPDYHLVSSIYPNGKKNDKVDCNSHPLR